MRLLLDTQAFLWFILAEPRLSATALGLITDPLNHKNVSPASYWEIAIKIRLGKYAVSMPFEPFMSDQISRNYFTILPITVKHAAVLTMGPDNQPFQHATSCIIMGAGNGLRLSTSPRQGCINHYVLARVLAPTPMPTPTLAAPRISTDSRHSSLSDASN